jgi:hypothetical protein
MIRIMRCTWEMGPLPERATRRTRCVVGRIAVLIVIMEVCSMDKKTYLCMVVQGQVEASESETARSGNP